MTYQELKTLTKGKTLPITGKNVDGENVVIRHGIDHWWRRFFHLQTAQHNRWTRINQVFETGTTYEEYVRSNK